MNCFSAPQSLEEFAGQSANLQPLLATIQEMAAGTREALGEERLAWLRDSPRLHVCSPVALVHASPESPWRAPTPEASDALAGCGIPHSDWIAKMLASGSFQMP